MAGLLSEMLSRHIERGKAEEFLFGLLMRVQQRFDFAAQIIVGAADFAEESRTLGRGTFQRLVQQSIYSRPTIWCHKEWLVVGGLWLAGDCTGHQPPTTTTLCSRLARGTARLWPCSIRG